MVRFRIQSIPANHSDCSFQLRNEAALEWKPDLPLLAQRIRSIPVTNGVCWLGCAPARCRHISRSTLAQNNKWRYSTDTARTRNFIQIVGEKWCKGKYQLLAEAYMRDVQHHYTRCYRNRSALSGPLGYLKIICLQIYCHITLMAILFTIINVTTFFTSYQIA